MFGFLKRIFPKKGENLDDLDDMYYEEQENSEDEDVPKLQNVEQPEGNKIAGILPDLWAKLRHKSESKDDSAELEPVLSFRESEEEPESSRDSHGILERINNLEGAPKVAFLGVVTLLVGVMAYSGIKLFKGDSKPRRTERPPAIERQAQVQTETKNDASKDNPMQVASATPEGTGLDNPFLEGLAPEADNDGTTKEEKSRSSEIPDSARALPSIPSVPYPVIPEGMAAMPGPAPEAPPANSNVVQGVITGSNESENLAIMGDGRVVSVGETFNDGRIAFIGGDGITFEDGSQIKMKP